MSIEEICESWGDKKLGEKKSGDKQVKDMSEKKVEEKQGQWKVIAEICEDGEVSEEEKEEFENLNNK